VSELSEHPCTANPCAQCTNWHGVTKRHQQELARGSVSFLSTNKRLIIYKFPL
jgi:hypothetical protein